MTWLFRYLLKIWVRLTGCRIDPAAAPWLQGPEGQRDRIGADFFERLARSHHWQINPHAGLLQRFSELEGRSLNTDEIDPQVHSFYEHTAAYRLIIWPEWNPLVKPFASWFVRSYCRHAQQFNLPLSVRDTCHGVSNRVIALMDPASNQRRYAAWIRCNSRTDTPMYVSSFSAIAQIPGYPDPCIKVVFPILQGSAIVFLGPTSKQGKLVLDSTGHRFGDLGLYVTQRDRKKRVRVTYARAFQEHLEVFVDPRGQLRGDHQFKIGWFPILRLYYQFDRRSDWQDFSQSE